MGKGETLLNALVGATVTVVLSVIVISPLLGGGAAGYLQQGTRGSGAKVGAISGVIAAIPFLLFLVLVFGFFGGSMLGGGAGLPGGIELVVVFLVLLPFLLVWNVGLGAGGGYLGASLRGEPGTG